MVVKFKFNGKWGQREAKILVREKSLIELLSKPIKMKWILDAFMGKSEYLIGIEKNK